MRWSEIKTIVVIVTVMAVIFLMKSDYYEGILLLISSVILLIVDSIPQKKSYLETESLSEPPIEIGS